MKCSYCQSGDASEMGLELQNQKMLWILAGEALNAEDDRLHQVRFMDIHKPIQRIDAVLGQQERAIK